MGGIDLEGYFFHSTRWECEVRRGGSRMILEVLAHDPQRRGELAWGAARHQRFEHNSINPSGVSTSLWCLDGPALPRCPTALRALRGAPEDAER